MCDSQNPPYLLIEACGPVAPGGCCTVGCSPGLLGVGVGVGRDEELHHLVHGDHLLDDQEFLDPVEVVHAHAQVRGGQVGVGDVDHRAVGAAAHRLLDGLAYDLGDHAQDGREDLGVLLDGRARAHVHEATTADLAGDVVVVGDLGGHVYDALVHAGQLVGIERARVDLGRRRVRARLLADLGHVHERIRALGLPGLGEVLVDPRDEAAEGVVGGAELLAVHARVRALPLERDDGLPAAEAVDVDVPRVVTVQRDEAVPRADDFFRHHADVELADLLVDAEPEVDRGVVGDDAVRQIEHGLDEDGDAGFVVGRERRVATRRDDGQANLLGEVLVGRDTVRFQVFKKLFPWLQYAKI